MINTMKYSRAQAAMKFMLETQADLDTAMIYLGSPDVSVKFSREAILDAIVEYAMDEFEKSRNI